MERLKLLLKYQRDFFFVGFLFLGAIAIITWAIGFFQYGIALAGTLPILPYYSPHKYNVIAYSLFYLLFYDRRFKNLAFPYFMLCYLAQEAIAYDFRFWIFSSTPFQWRDSLDLHFSGARRINLALFMAASGASNESLLEVGRNWNLALD